MAKSKGKVITIEDFIKKATERQSNKKMFADIETGMGLLRFKRPSDNQLLSYMNEVAKGVKGDKDGNVIETNLGVMYEAGKELIYNTCEYLHNEELHKALDIVDPLDAVKVFGINEVVEISGQIADEFNTEDIQAKIKNS